MFEDENYDDLVQNFDDQAQNYAGAPGGGQMRKAITKQQANFDLVMVNAHNETLTFELFNELRSFVENQNVSYITGGGTVAYVPQLSVEGLTLAGVGIVNYNKLGLLTATGAAAAVKLTVDCPQYTYKALVKSSGRRPFRIVGIRMTVQNDAQIDQTITHFTNTFLGSKNQNELTPRTYFNPNQFQGKIVDIKCDFPIDDQKGLVYKLIAGETVKWNVLIERGV